MDRARKELLAEYKAKKRQRTCLLKDLLPTDLLMLIDRAEEAGTDYNHVADQDRPAYLSRATTEQVEALASRLPYAWTFLRGYPRGRFVVLFAESHLHAVLGYVMPRPQKYVKAPRRPRVGSSDLTRGLFVGVGNCECDPYSSELCADCANWVHKYCKGMGNA